MQIGICAGHSNHPDHRGVTYGDLEEWQICREVVNELRLLLLDAGLEVYDPLMDMRELPYPNYLNERISAFNAERVDAVVAVHLNDVVPGRDPDQNYVTMLHAPGSKRGERLADMLAASCIRELDGLKQTRGPWVGTDVNYRGEDSPLGLLRRTVMPAAIAEPCFLSAPDVQDQARYKRQNLVDMMAVGLTHGIVTWAEDSERRMAALETIEGEA